MGVGGAWPSFIKHCNGGGAQLWNRQHGGNRPEDTQGESMMNENDNVSHLKLLEPVGICPCGVAVRLSKSENLKSRVTPPSSK